MEVLPVHLISNLEGQMEMAESIRSSSWPWRRQERERADPFFGFLPQRGCFWGEEFMVRA
ncbi:MAG: hypothetical protein CL912_14670 [Deltaproteobacteria bacterium]|nr:hypothetical protein [Deltaproteobacteria bacterium]